MDADREGVIIYTDKVISYFDGKKDPHEERNVRKKLRQFRDHFSPEKLDDFQGYKGTSTVKKAKTNQYRAVFIWIADGVPFRIIQVIKVFNKNKMSAPSQAFLEAADSRGKQLKKKLQNASEAEIEAIIHNLGDTTEKERPPK